MDREVAPPFHLGENAVITDSKCETQVMDRATELTGQLGENDVITGTKRGTKLNTGNQKFKLMIDQNFPTYISIEKSKKAKMRRAIIDKIKNNGGRFVKLDNRLWTEIPTDCALVFVQTAFDSLKQHPQRRKRVPDTISGLRQGGTPA